MVRRIAAVFAGIVTVGVVVVVLQWVGSRLYPLPPGLDPMDPASRDALLAHTAGMPLLSWLLAFSSEILGAFLGGWVAGRIAGDRHRLFVGIIVGVAVLGSLMNWVSFPHPRWFMAGQLVGYPLAFLGAVRALRGPIRAAP